VERGCSYAPTYKLPAKAWHPDTHASANKQEVAVRFEPEHAPVIIASDFAVQRSQCTVRVPPG